MEGSFNYNNPALLDYECDGQLDIFDLYGVANIIELQKNAKKDEFISNVELCNFVSIEAKDEPADKCRCGGELIEDNIPLIHKQENQVHYFAVCGRKCKDCGRKYVIKDRLGEYYKEKIEDE